MSASITPQPEPTTQQQIDALTAKIAALEAEKTEGAAWWQKLSAKVVATGGWKHTIWITWLGLTTVIAADPAAHQAFLSLWAHVPKWGVDLVAIGGPIAAYFISPSKASAQ